MPLVAIPSLLMDALRGGYALGYFESWNLESLQGVIDAAEEVRAPILIGFNGGFLSGPDRLAPERLGWYAALGRQAATSASVPCALLFNECPADDWTRLAMTLGFDLVMPADPAADLRAYTGRVAALTRQAHALGVAVEAELGQLPAGTAGHGTAAGSLTEPTQAAEFVAATGIDLLAVSVGNVHVKVDGSQELDLSRLERIREQVDIPLVLHGGTGIAPASLRQAIERGVAKVNLGTYLKQRYLEAVAAHLGRECLDPHRRLGMGGEDDIMVAGRRAVRDAVLERIVLLGCCDRAERCEPTEEWKERPWTSP
jgi:fructose/tagatose bisphosphate aldolase